MLECAEAMRLVLPSIWNEVTRQSLEERIYSFKYLLSEFCMIDPLAMRFFLYGGEEICKDEIREYCKQLTAPMHFIARQYKSASHEFLWLGVRSLASVWGVCTRELLEPSWTETHSRLNRLVEVVADTDSGHTRAATPMVKVILGKTTIAHTAGFSVHGGM